MNLPEFITTWNVADIISIASAAVLGAVIGLERQIHDKPAGLRTNILICIGACVFMIISRSIAQGSDQARIAAQIVTGIGFLGAGSIIRGSNGIHGLTSAAGIWIVASIGMACGAEMYQLAITTTLIAAVVLIILNPVARKIKKKKGKTKNEVLNR